MLVLLDVCFWYLKDYLDFEMRAHDVRLIIQIDLFIKWLSGILDSDWSVPTFWGVLFHDNNTLIWVFEVSASFTSLISRFAKGWNISRNLTKIPRLQKILESLQNVWNIKKKINEKSTFLQLYSFHIATLANWWVFVKYEPKSSQLKEPKT